MKPTLGDALSSVLNQTRKDAQIIVADSGAWLSKWNEGGKAIGELYSQYKDHPMIQWVFTGEAPGEAKRTCMVGKVFNEVVKAGLVRGKYFCTFYDDDLYHPRFFEDMIAYFEANPDCEALRCSERWVKMDTDGNLEYVRTLTADTVLTAQDTFAGRVDGMQVMIKTEVLARMAYPWLTEDVAQCRISDGLYFDALKHHVKQVDYLNEELCTHRFTPNSTFTPTHAL